MYLNIQVENPDVSPLELVVVLNRWKSVEEKMFFHKRVKLYMLLIASVKEMYNWILFNNKVK